MRVCSNRFKRCIKAGISQTCDPSRSHALDLAAPCLGAPGPAPVAGSHLRAMRGGERGWGAFNPSFNVGLSPPWLTIALRNTSSSLLYKITCPAPSAGPYHGPGLKPRMPGGAMGSQRAPAGWPPPWPGTPPTPLPPPSRPGPKMGSPGPTSMPPPPPCRGPGSIRPTANDTPGIHGGRFERSLGGQGAEAEAGSSPS